MKTLYTAVATAWGGREGRAASSDGNVDVQLAYPKELGGPDGATNPEQLFAVGWAGCFHNAMRSVAKRLNVDVSDSAVTAHVALVMHDDGTFSLSALLEAEVPGLNQVEATKLVEATHERCPYSKATRGNVPVEVRAIAGR